MPRVTKKSIMTRKFNAYFNIESTSEESSTEEEICPPKKRKLNDDSRIKLHQLPGVKQKSLETKSYNKDHYNEGKAYVESVEAAFHSQVESFLKLAFEYQKCIASEINNIKTSAQTKEAYLSESVYSHSRYHGDKFGYAESFLKIQKSYKKEFKDLEKSLKEAKAKQNDVENQYMALQEKIKNDIKKEWRISARKARHNVFKI